MPQQLTKEDFLKHVPLSKNLSEGKLTPYIQDALLMDVKPLLGDLYTKWQDGTQPFMGSAEDGMEEVDLVKAVWVFNAYVRFLPFHGISVTSSGITKSKDTEGTYEQASHQERQQVIASYRSKISYWEGELGKAIKAINGVGRPIKRKSRIGIRVVGTKS
ncbi:DUF6712 family protein [Pontibacter sp. H249]|uniref:DUF6712 family protein n=1 Tax=Pontibacter sp. H249 TaxID=3133420 RepID=UPI0030BC3F82